MAVYDETWKEAMDQWFEPFVAFFFPQVHRDIDWSRGWQSRDAELRQVVPDAEFGVKRADKLVQVWRPQANGAGAIAAGRLDDDAAETIRAAVSAGTRAMGKGETDALRHQF